MLKKKEDELPEETISRLEQQLKELNSTQAEEERIRKEQEESDRFWTRYDSDITSFVESQESMTDSEKSFLSELLRKDSFINNVNVENQVEVRKMTKQVAKMMDDLKQDIIKDYREGKVDTPPASSTEESVTSLDETKPKTIADSGKLAAEILRKKFGWK